MVTGRLPEVLKHQLEELRQLGPKGTLFRVYWEFLQRIEPRLTDLGLISHQPGEHHAELRSPFPKLFGDGATIAQKLRPLLAASDLAALKERAEAACEGRIFGFGHLWLDHGSPFDWHLHPPSGNRWPEDLHWRQVLRRQRDIGDVKLTWEAGRFPQLYHLARAAVFFPQNRERYLRAASEQINGFIAQNPAPFGVHWASGQEIAFRLMAWTFALHIFHELRAGTTGTAIASAMVQGAEHIAKHIDYARLATYNNHLLSEAVGLLLVATLVPDAKHAPRWRRISLQLLHQQASRQFYEDGGYIQQSHTYQRLALTDYLWAIRLLAASRQGPPESWKQALSRSMTFLWSQQNPPDGALPNYGNNDGAQPSILSCAAYADFRPIIEAVALTLGQNRRYPLGPWSEAAAWYCGVDAITTNRDIGARHSQSFGTSGHHVLRSRQDSSTFATFRCGTLKDRFSQIDMLHVDLWWRGLNVLVDAGTYHYNNAAAWHEHFMSGRSHNTLTIDGHDQMLHYRQFKLLYPAPAELLGFHVQPTFSCAWGEHQGFVRHPGHAIHRRAVTLYQDWLLVVLDTIRGEGEHALRLNWQLAPFPHRHDPGRGEVILSTAAGDLMVAIKHLDGRPAATDCFCGEEDPPAGWLSRYYAKKTPAPALIHQGSDTLPARRVTLVAPHGSQTEVEDGRFKVSSPAGQRAVFIPGLDGTITVLEEHGS